MDKKKNLFIVLGIFALVIITSAVSFAFFTYSRTGNTKATIISGDIEFSYIEGDSAELTNAFPVSDSIGAIDETGEYDFQVKLNSSGTTSASYNVYLVDNNTSTNHFTNEQIKFALIKNDVFVANTSATEGVKLSQINGFAEGSHNGEGIVLENQEISSGEVDNYKLRIWISDDVSYTNEYQSDGTMDGKYNSYTYSLKVKVTSNTKNLYNKIPTADVIINEDIATITLSDESGITAYAITETKDTPNDEEWIYVNADGTIKQMSTNKNFNITYQATKAGTYYLHMLNKNNYRNVIEFMFSEDAFCQGDWCEWLTYENLEPKNYESLPVFLEDTENVEKLIANEDAMKFLATSTDDIIPVLKESTNYTGTYSKLLLNSSYLTEVEKYNAGLPFYLFKNGTCGFKWQQNKNTMNKLWCQNMDTSCREGNASIGSTLYIYDNSTSYYYGTQLYSEEVDLSKYSNLTFKYTLNGTSGGTETQYRQQAAYLSMNNTNIWGIDYKLSNLSGTKTINNLNYEKASVKFFMYSGGLTQYQTNFSVPYIYFY